MPKRIQRKRTNGWRKPPGSVIVSRPTRWGNLFRVGVLGSTAEDVVELFRAYAIDRSANDPSWLEPLRGRDLACWCPEDARHCHADVLLELANKERA